jgi:hypothetical protein
MQGSRNIGQQGGPAAGGDRRATLVFHDGLKDLLCGGNQTGGIERTNGVVRYPVTRRASVKDVIEALGPPHCEVARIQVDGRDAGFAHLLRPCERVDVHPHTPPVDVLRPSPLRPRPLPRVAFIADVNVGRLATLLRTLGYDTLYDNSLSDEEVADLAEAEDRIVLSKDRNLLKRNKINYGYLVKEEEPQAQVDAVLRFFGLSPRYKPFARCPRCNSLLVPISKAAVRPRLEPLTKRHFQEFHLCPGCDKVYWPGSHHEYMARRIERMARDL